MIEILVSALVILIVAGAVLSLITATTRSAADQRQKAAAYSVAQEDQARLRAMRLSSLNRLEQSRTVTLDGTKYTVVSRGRFVNNSTGSDSSCESSGSSADYVRIGTTVTWLGGSKTVSMNSVVAPSSGSLNPNNGGLLITVENGSNQKLAGVGLSGSGAGTFSGTSDSNGCANFSDLAVGNYTLKAEAPGFVNADGVASPWTQTIGVEAAQTKSAQLRYDLPGQIEAKFKYKEGSTYVAAKADSIVVYNANMTSGAKSFWSSGKTRASSVTATSLFPFTEADTVYTGACETNLPSEAAGRATPIVPRNGAVTAEILMPTLNLKVVKGSPTPTVVSGAKVVVTDESCVVSGSNVKREYLSNNSGAMSLSGGTSAAEPALPWGAYKVCVQATVGTENRRVIKTGVSVKNLTSGTSLETNLTTTGSEGGSTKTC